MVTFNINNIRQHLVIDKVISYYLYSILVLASADLMFDSDFF